MLRADLVSTAIYLLQPVLDVGGQREIVMQERDRIDGTADVISAELSLTTTEPS